MPIGGAHAVVIGRGLTVGRPLGLLLTRRSENATVTLCHTGTRDLAGLVMQGDIVVAAAGSPGLITGEMIKPMIFWRPGHGVTNEIIAERGVYRNGCWHFFNAEVHEYDRAWRIVTWNDGAKPV